MTKDQGHQPRDVRMRGFARRATVEEATGWIHAVGRELPSEAVIAWQAARRVLASDVVSPVNVPPFVRSMMDGYAVQAADTLGASAYNRLDLRITGQSLPGNPFAGQIQRGTAVRIMTGAPLPAGADAVVPAEIVEAAGDQLLVLGEVSPGKNVGQVGEDVSAGQTVLAKGRRLRPQDVGLLSSIGCASVAVIREPRVQIVITGNELLPAGSKPQGERIVDANGPMLAALVERDGGIAQWLNSPAGMDMETADYLVPDDPDAILAAMRVKADIVLVSGGSSVGQEDFAPSLLAQHGELVFHGLAMRPSSPTGMGRLDGRLVFLLPGNPVSCLCAYDFFAGRAIRLFGGRDADWPYRSVRLPLVRKLVSQVGRVDYARVRLSGGLVEPLAIGGASILSSTTIADGFVVVPADSEGYPAGAEVEVFLYDPA